MGRHAQLFFVGLLGLLMVAVSTMAQVPKPHIDRAFVNGKIWTADGARPVSIHI